PPPRPDLGRRYVDLLAENLGQPGFRELLIVAHDIDARHDLTFALLADAHRPRLFSRPAGEGPRPAEPIHLAGQGRDHLVDALAIAGGGRAHVVDASPASLAMPIGADPRLVKLAAEGPWKGETHRVCDRPGALARLLEEVVAAGAEQVIVVSAAPAPAHPHELGTSRADPRGRAAEQLVAFEAAGLRDALPPGGTAFANAYA